MTSVRLAVCVALSGSALAGVSPAAAQQLGYAVQQQAETPSATLARCLRTLAADPKNFASLIAAGKAAVAIGDSDAAAGFFARADEVSPRSPLPQAGMGAVAVANGDARAAMPYFNRALQLGATVASIASDRGLAYDLLGNQAQAQADYRAALSGPDADEARRRLALSLAISGDRNGALQTLAPLQARGDTATGRVRAFVLALTGDTNDAMVATDAAMPGTWKSVAPFLQRLSALAPGQKAAAVNLGIFPDSGSAALTTASTSVGVAPTYGPRTAPTQPMGGRLASIDELLRAPAPAPAPIARPAAAAPQMALATPTVRQAIPAPAPATRATAPAASSWGKRLWLQLASGADPATLSAKFQRLRNRGGEIFDGIPGYVARSSDGTKLVIGPFRSSEDARTFSQDLQDLNISASSWTNAPSDTIVPLNEAS